MHFDLNSTVYIYTVRQDFLDKPANPILLKSSHLKDLPVGIGFQNENCHLESLKSLFNLPCFL